MTSLGELWLRGKVEHYGPEEFARCVDHQLVWAAVKDILNERTRMNDDNVTTLFPTDEDGVERYGESYAKALPPGIDAEDGTEGAIEAPPEIQTIFVKPEPTVLLVIRGNVDPLSLDEAKGLVTDLVASIAEAEAVG